MVVGGGYTRLRDARERNGWQQDELGPVPPITKHSIPLRTLLRGPLPMAVCLYYIALRGENPAFAQEYTSFFPRLPQCGGKAAPKGPEKKHVATKAKTANRAWGVLYNRR